MLMCCDRVLKLNDAYGKFIYTFSGVQASSKDLILWRMGHEIGSETGGQRGEEGRGMGGNIFNV